MPYLYIANTTKQHHDFAYRLPEALDLRYETIRAGSQARLPIELSHDVITGIVKQHERYGLKNVADLQGNRDFVGLVYSIDKPVKLDRILETFEQNDTVLNKKGEERRETTAAAISQEMSDVISEGGGNVSRTEVEVIEDTKGKPGVATGYETTRRDGVESRRGGARNK